MILEEVLTFSGAAYFYHTDQLGSVRALTNSTGGIANTYDYDAYGKQMASTGSTYNPFGYAGEYQDAESGLYYLRARYYDPQTQQFLTRDPMEALSRQPYAYAGGSPVNVKDPTGRWVWIVVAAVAGGIIGGGVNIMSQVANGAGPRDINWGEVFAAAGAGAITGAVGAFFLPLGIAASDAVGGGLLGNAFNMGINYFGSYLGGLAGQTVFNALQPCYASDPMEAARWSGIGGAIFAPIPIARMSGLRQAWNYKLQTYRFLRRWDTGIPTVGEAWNISKLSISYVGSNAVGNTASYWFAPAKASR